MTKRLLFDLKNICDFLLKNGVVYFFPTCEEDAAGVFEVVPGAVPVDQLAVVARHLGNFKLAFTTLHLTRIISP